MLSKDGTTDQKLDVIESMMNIKKVAAMILINQDKDVPEELIQKIEEYDKKILQLN